MEIVDGVFGSVFLDATFDVFLADIWIIGPDLRARSAIDVLRTVTEHVLITYVRPNESMVGLENIDIMEGEKTTAQNGETGGDPNAIDRLPFRVGRARGRNVLTTMIAYDCFVHSYLHQSFGYFTIADIVVGIHSQDHVVYIIA